MGICFDERNKRNNILFNKCTQNTYISNNINNMNINVNNYNNNDYLNNASFNNCCCSSCGEPAGNNFLVMTMNLLFV